MNSPLKRCPTCGATELDPEIAFCSLDGARLVVVPSVTEIIGAEIAGRYRVLERIGEGGMGTVYRARQLGMERDVALKIIRAELAGDASLQGRFQREARSASRVQSIRVVTLFDYGRTDDGLLFMAMELLDGESLADRLHRVGRLPPAEAIRVALEIARALETAHALDVVHRDLKPDNVYLTHREELVKVLDFGIAKLLSDGVEPDGQVTAAGSIIGTPLYMSPEAASAIGTVGPPSDLYSLGCVLFELLTGQPPFTDAEPVLLLGLHIRARPPLLSERAGDLELPDGLEALVDRLLAKDPAARPDASELAATLEAMMERLTRPSVDSQPAPLVTAASTPSAPASVPTPVTTPPSTRWPFVALAALLSLLGAGALVVVATTLGAADPEPSPAPPPLTASDPPPATSEATPASPGTAGAVPEVLGADTPLEPGDDAIDDAAEEPDDDTPAPRATPRRPREQAPDPFRQVVVD